MTIATIIEAHQTPSLEKIWTNFCSPTSTPRIMQDAVHGITQEIVLAAKSHDKALGGSTTMIPILRGALPMFVAAQPLLSSSCILVRCSKTKGTEDVVVDWLGREPFPAAPDDGKIVILDTIIATGDTVVKLCEELYEMSAEPGSVAVWCCYAAPDALARIAACPVVEYVVVGKKAERCDERGYLVPYTNGDIGDKIYGVSKEVVPATVVGSKSVISEVRELLVESGGGWRLTEDGRAIERDFQFSGFQKAWTFMGQVADMATQLRHHPEWTNVGRSSSPIASVLTIEGLRKGLYPLDNPPVQMLDGIGSGHGSDM
ncbi:unnamed protein product [Penicillium olsonii]|uniref:4a-hydroxytetrahydrobiopterin dehydratase n=1 Tax=Penicillium olsonii TaxID=99116 RepID=A0A9W4I053_PENOL|nr:unnamed protein product [Penicillium olsonii]CAG8198699.1 unnamed protein product [Penicillium olsonii]